MSTALRVLVVNAGSSSLKLRLLAPDDRVERSVDLAAGADLAPVLQGWPAPDAVGHRVVHGGPRTGPERVDRDVRAGLGALADLAPLHQPPSLAALDEVTGLLPQVPAVACFDTAFHATIPAGAATYAVPRNWRERYGVRRYGFHGLSHVRCAARSAQLLGRPVDGLRVVTCHLGAGASLAAVVGGRSVDTTMGFTPLEGLVMATRSGTVDPGLVLWLQDRHRMTGREVADALEHRSGLLALAGTADMRVVEAAADRAEPDALLALEVWTHRLVGSIAAMAAAAGGLDVLAFTGGVGEHSPVVRRRAVERLGFLGAALSDGRNEAVSGDADISSDGAAVRTLVITCREDLQIAAEVRALLAAPGA